MVLARKRGDRTDLTLAPWIRRDSLENETWFRRTRNWSIDVVHKDFLPSYIGDHISPFAERFGQLAINHQVELATGNAFAPGMGARLTHDPEHLAIRPRS
jgi:hypothetical protein